MYDTSKYPAYYPKYLPYWYDITRSKTAPVPNRQSIDWPQSQWAPRYLSPGSPSFQPYAYPSGPFPNIREDLKFQESSALLAGADCGCAGGAYGADCDCGCPDCAKKNPGAVPWWGVAGAAVGVAVLAYAFRKQIFNKK